MRGYGNILQKEWERMKEMKKWGKRVLCYVLSFAMLLSTMVVPEKAVQAKGTDVVTQQATDQSIGDLVGVLVDGETAGTLQIYLNGVYEGKVAIPAGEHTLQVTINGQAVGEARTVTLEAKEDISVRYHAGEIYDSITNQDKFHTAALTGNFQGIEFVDEQGVRYDIASWNPADPNAELAYLGGGLYKRTFLFKELEQDVEIKDGGYKVSFDDVWGSDFGDGSSNISVTIPKGTSTFTVLVDEVNRVIYDSVRSKEVTVTQNSGAVSYCPLDLTVSLIGTIRNNEAINWDIKNTEFEFVQINDSLFVCQTVVPAGAYQYKVTFDHEKWYEKSGNRSLQVTGENENIIIVYDANEEALYDSVNDKNTLSVLFGFTEEPAESKVLTNANGTTTFLTTVAKAETDQVQLVYADRKEMEKATTVTLSKVTDNKGNFKGSFQTEELFFGDEAVELAYYYLVNGEKVLDASAPTVTVGEEEYSQYTREAFVGRTVTVPGTFPGKSWDAASNVMTYLGNGLYSYTFKEVPPANYEFKIAMGSWKENYGVNGKFDGSNYAVTVTKKQDITVYYTDLRTHRAVTSLNYVFADITLTGSGIPEGMKLLDEGLTGIYSNKVVLPAGTYSDLVIGYNGTTYPVEEFVLPEEKEVTFYFDPSTEIYYNNSTEVEIDASKVCYDSKDIKYKSTFGAIEEGKEVTFSIQTDVDVTKAKLVIKGKENTTVDLAKVEQGEGYLWSGTTEFNTYGEYEYFFVLYYGSYVKVYCDDDGYYGTGTLADLNALNPYDVVVYKAGYETPDWMKNAIIYQIFPDRFYNGDTKNDKAQITSRGATDYEFVKDWYTLPENPEQEELNPDTYPSNAYLGDGNWSNEIYGGDLNGIIDRIEYLKALGVNVIYLNPVFSSISSHRYDTSDYLEIDPILGDLGDFEELVKVCEANKMHLVLDGVFNHVSDDSIYFDRYYKFVGKEGKVGAYPYWAYVYDFMAANDVTQEVAEEEAKTYFASRGVTDFTYTDWFVVTNTTLKDEDGVEVTDTIGDRKGKEVYGYDGWWGYDSMPVVKSVNGSEYQTESWAKEIIDGENSVTEYWLTKGSDGWRLDVANEVSDETWQHFRQSVKALNSDNVIIGEIWDDATKYILGDMYDSVMNYIFRNAVLAFAKGGNASESVATLEKIRERYPKEAFYAMMNLVGSHDTTRVLSYLDGIDDDRNQKEIEKAFPSYETTSKEAKARQYVVAFIQMTYPGAPMIYYGDEIGMVGADDPDNRRAMTWGYGNKELVEWYATMAKVRESYGALRTGDIIPFTVRENGKAVESVMAYVRKDASDQLVVVANNSLTDATVTIEIAKEMTLSGSSVTDVVSGTVYPVVDGEVTVTIPACKGVVLTEHAKAITLNKEALKPAYDSNYVVKPEEPPVKPEETKLTLDKKAVSLFVGDTVKVTATVTPAGAVKWASADASIATVDQTGKITAKKAGTVKITATVGKVSAFCTVKVEGIANVTGVKATSVTSNAISLYWNKVAGATGYEVYQLKGKTWVKVYDGAATTYKSSQLVWSTTYSYKVRAYRVSNGVKNYGGYSNTSTVKTKAIANPGKVMGLKVAKKSSSKVGLTWKKVSGATGYQIYRKANSGSYKLVKTIASGSTTSYTKTGLLQGYKYSFRVRAVKKVSGKTAYGSYSSTASIRMTVNKPTGLKVARVSSSKAKVTFNKVSGVSGYVVYMKTGTGAYKKVATLNKNTKNTYIKTGLKKRTTYTFKVKAYKTVKGVNYYSAYSTSKQITMK